MNRPWPNGRLRVARKRASGFPLPSRSPTAVTVTVLPRSRCHLPPTNLNSATRTVDAGDAGSKRPRAITSVPVTRRRKVRVVGCLSSFWIVPTPVASEIVAPVGLERTTWKVSFDSNVVSPFTSTVIDFNVALEPKESPPLFGA